MKQVETRSIDSRSSAEERLREALVAREESDQLRRLANLNGIDFCSNDYLGLSKFVIDDAQQQTVIGSGGSRLISGNSPEIESLEQHIAHFHGFEHGLLFNSGYAANTGLLACLGQRGDRLFFDSLVHASLIDGARLSFAKRSRFAHNDVSDLAEQLNEFSKTRLPSQQAFVVIESLYSMDGDIAPIKNIADVCQQYNAALIIDEAHSIGVYGEQGEGLVAQLNLQSTVFASVLTFGKAMGCHGAVIAGSNTLRDYLVNFCRPFIYTTAPSPHTVSMLTTAHQRMSNANQARTDLRNNIAYFEKVVKSLPLKDLHWLASNSPIQGLIIGNAKRAKSIATTLLDDGFALKAIVSPTVSEGGERLRICLHSHNTHSEIDQFSQSLALHLGVST